MKRSKNNEDFINQSIQKRKKIISRIPHISKRKWEPITLVNVVVTGTTNCDLDLHKLSKHLFNAEYFPKKFAALKLCRTDPFSKALVFRSGKIVCVGAVSIEHAFNSLNWFVERIKQIQGDDVELKDRGVQNLVAFTKFKNEKKKFLKKKKIFDNCPSFF